MSALGGRFCQIGLTADAAVAHNCGDMATGRAAGISAALAAARAVSPRAVDVRTLRSALIEAGPVIREKQMV
ncbi:MAG TPA: hypothetical protein VJT33_08890 [bacterium]|nr:hypothetical protein [bacterium]